jgi:hypothetical protein
VTVETLHWERGTAWRTDFTTADAAILFSPPSSCPEARILCCAVEIEVELLHADGSSSCSGGKRELVQQVDWEKK